MYQSPKIARIVNILESSIEEVLGKSEDKVETEVESAWFGTHSTMISSPSRVEAFIDTFSHLGIHMIEGGPAARIQTQGLHTEDGNVYYITDRLISRQIIHEMDRNEPCQSYQIDAEGYLDRLANSINQGYRHVKAWEPKTAIPVGMIIDRTKAMQLMEKEKELRGKGYSEGLMDLWGKKQLDEGAMSMLGETIPGEAFVGGFVHEIEDTYSRDFAPSWIKAFYKSAIRIMKNENS